MKVSSVSLSKLQDIFFEMNTIGVKYGLGSKVPYLDIAPSKIKKIDCSGFTRYAIYKATEGKLLIPDGSQAQREWCEKSGLKKLDSYADVQRTKVPSLYVAFIKPWANGCKDIGHVWFVTKLDDDDILDTMESHGGVGVNSRPWNYITLRKQVYSCYEIPVN